MHKPLYAPWPEGARRSWGWGALGLTLAAYAASALPVVIGTMIYIAVSMISGSGADEAQAALAGGAFITFLAPLLLSQFVLWSVLIWLWARYFERRTLASMGVRRKGALGRYGLGLLLGLGLITLIGAAAAGLTALFPDAAPDIPDLAAGPGAAVFSPGVIMVLALVAFGFLIQGGAEEFVFRGWLMSTLTARWGVKAGVAASSLAFALFHAHVFVSGVLFGITVLIGLGFTGLVFALLCVLRQSLLEAAGAHGAFNAAVVIAPVLALKASDPEMSLSDALSRVFTTATGAAGPDAAALSAPVFAQLLTGALVSAVLLILIARRRG